MKFFSLACLVIAVGWLIGNFSGGWLAVTGKRSPGEISVLTRRENRERQAISTSSTEGHDLGSLLRWHRQQASGGLELRNEIGRMDSNAIRDLMTRLVTQNEAMVDIRDALTVAAGELFHREGMKSLEWAYGLASTNGRADVLEQVIGAAASEAPKFAQPWILRFQAEFGKGVSNSFFHAAINGATARGAEDLIRLREIYGDELRGLRFPNENLPNGFDFHRLLTGVPDSMQLDHAVEYWAAKDRDAAWAGMMEITGRNQLAGANYLGSIFSGIAAVEGDKNAARWIVGKLDEIPPDFRDRAISSLLTNQLVGNAGYKTVMSELPRDSDRVALAASIASPFGNPVAAVGALRFLGSESLQADALVASTKVYGRMASGTQGPDSQKVRDYFSNTMDQLGLSAANRERINANLIIPK
jgi:hypothetical protein